MKKTLFLLTLALLIPASGAHAQRVSQKAEPPLNTASAENQGIVAVVNDEVISTFDLSARIKIAQLSSGMPDTPEMRQRLAPQIFRTLVDEQLQLQEAKQLDISVSDAEIGKALNQIASDNDIPMGMEAFLKNKGASPQSLKNQIRAAIAWSKVVQRELRPKVNVSDDEVDAAVDRIRANAGKEEFLVSEIFLPVEQVQDEAQIEKFSENLVQQIKGGAPFSAVARQFSQGTGAANGGDIGWIQEGQLATELNSALLASERGQLVGPVRASDGYHIFGIRDKRVVANTRSGDIEVSLQQIFNPSQGNDIAAEANTIKTSFKSCDDLKDGLKAKFPSWTAQNLGQSTLAKIPGWMVDKVRGLKAGEASEPINTAKGTIILFMCSRTEGMDGIDRNAITASIGTERLELQARRLLRDLRRNAYIDVRLGAAQ